LPRDFALPARRRSESAVALIWVKAIEPWMKYMIMMLWERRGDAFYSTAETAWGAIRLYLIVEQIADGTCEWTAWCPAEPLEKARCGAARTIQGAMWQAELASMCDIVS
jgi:hypothetical protein